MAQISRTKNAEWLIHGEPIQVQKKLSHCDK